MFLLIEEQVEDFVRTVSEMGYAYFVCPGSLIVKGSSKSTHNNSLLVNVFRVTRELCTDDFPHCFQHLQYSQDQLLQFSVDA